jgi:hypothetical protein
VVRFSSRAARAEKLMPNGGSDCCGTCPFNRKNRGEAGYSHAQDPGPDHCEIRDLAIGGAAFWTYCSNHPNHNRELIRIPIGPVYVHGERHGREVWRQGPDTPEVRGEILRLLAAATPDPIDDYPAGFALVEAAIIHAGAIGDARFDPHLDRIRRFPGFADGVARGSSFARDPAVSSALATESLTQVLPPVQIMPFRTEPVRAIAATVNQTGDASGLPVLADALQEAGCAHAPTLEYLRNPDARTPNWVVDVILGRIVLQPS